MNNNTLLIVEDSLDDYMFIMRALKMYNINLSIYHCSSGKDLLDKFLKIEASSFHDKPVLPVLILLDLNLPDLDGQTLLDEIRSHPEYSVVPVTVFTSSTTNQDIQMCYQRGANSYVEKPSNLLKFNQIIKEIVTYWFEVNMPSTVK